MEKQELTLADLLHRGLPTPTSPGLPDIDPLVTVARRVLDRWPNIVREPPEKDRERLVQIVLRKLESGNWDGTKLSLVTSAGRALFDEERRDRSDLAELRQFYYDEIRASTRHAYLSAMFEIYLSTFDPKSSHSQEISEALKSVSDRLQGRWITLLAEFPNILTPGKAHAVIAKKMVDMESPYHELKEKGLRNPHSPGIMDFAHLSYLNHIGRELETQAGAARLFDWLKPDGVAPRQTGASESIAALLKPWLNKDPGALFRGYLVENLVGLYHDPRVHPGGAWNGLPEEHHAVMMRWLTGENIRFFLDVVSEVEDSHMWAPRRKFWLGLHEQGRIDAAWVAFSDRGVDVARRRSQGKDRSGLSFGRQTAGGSRINTSLLVLQIGNKIVVEGSHNYKVHVFREDAKNAPKLYQRTYDCELIRLLPGAEAKSHLGDWQSWVQLRT